jgi:hypothetical protein
MALRPCRRALHDFFKHVAVSAVHAVEVPDTTTVGPKSAELLEFVEDMLGSSFWPLSFWPWLNFPF